MGSDAPPTCVRTDEEEQEAEEGAEQRTRLSHVALRRLTENRFFEQTAAKHSKKAKKSKSKDDDEEDDVPDGVRIEMNQHVNLTFSLKYLVNFSKSSSLSNVVQLMMSNDVPLLVSLAVLSVVCIRC